MPHSSNPKKMISTFSYQADKGYDFYCDELGVCTGSTIGLGLQSLKHPSSFISQAIKVTSTVDRLLHIHFLGWIVLQTPIHHSL